MYSILSFCFCTGGCLPRCPGGSTSTLQGAGASGSGYPGAAVRGRGSSAQAATVTSHPRGLSAMVLAHWPPLSGRSIQRHEEKILNSYQSMIRTSLTHLCVQHLWALVQNKKQTVANNHVCMETLNNDDIQDARQTSSKKDNTHHIQSGGTLKAFIWTTEFCWFGENASWIQTACESSSCFTWTQSKENSHTAQQVREGLAEASPNVFLLFYWSFLFHPTNSARFTATERKG